MRKFYYFLGILLFQCSVSFAQTRQLFAKILDAKDKSPLSGVTVSTKGSKASAVSGPDGSFSIRVGAKATALHFSYIGFDDQEVPIGTAGEPPPFFPTPPHQSPHQEEGGWDKVNM